MGSCCEISAKEPVNCDLACVAVLLLQHGSHGCILESINCV